MPIYMSQLAMEIDRDQATWPSSDHDYDPAATFQYLNEKLKGRALYTFSRSAVSAAADVRVGSAKRLEAMLAALAHQDRSVFIEASPRDINDHLVPLHEMVEINNLCQNSFLDEYTIDRVGYLIDVSNGEISVEAFSITSTDFANDSFDLEAYRGVPQKSVARLKKAARFSHDGSILKVRPKSSLPSREDFMARLTSSSDIGGTPIERAFLPGAGSPERKRRIEEAWWIARYHAMLSEQDIESEPLAALSFPQLAPITTASIALSMLAALDAAGDGIEVQPFIPGSRARPKKDRRPRPSPRDGQGINLVTLNLADKELERLYEAPRPQTESAEGKSSQDRSAMVRHPVRGHLFLARNGKITWRRPHWRGSATAPRLTRVVSR